jgi:hypothetical protein
MSGYFSRGRYDNCYTIDYLESSIKPGNLILDTIQEPNTACFSKNGPRNTRNLNSSEIDINYNNAIDIESSLKGLDLPVSRCINNNSLIERDTKLLNIYNNIPKKKINQCSNYLEYDYTRLNSQNNLNEIAYNRYEYPIIDPVEYVFSGFKDNDTFGNNRSGIPSRIYVKNNLEITNKKMRINARKYDKVIAFNS